MATPDIGTASWQNSKKNQRANTLSFLSNNFIVKVFLSKVTMIFSTLSTVFLGLVVSIPNVAAGPCKPGSTQSLDEQTSTATATTRALDITTTVLSSVPTTTSQESTSLPAVTTTVAAPEVFAGGQATFYFQNGNFAQCGGRHTDDELVVALDYRRFDMSLCGRKLRVTNGMNGQTVDVTVVETCPTCLNANSLDLSEEAFRRIGSLSDGSYFVTWSYI